MNKILNAKNRKKSKIFLKNKQYIFIFVVLFSLFGFLKSETPVFAATILSDDFTGTTIDTAKWVEIENQGAGDGGSLGNVRQNDTLTVVGNSNWNSNGLKSVDTFDRSLGDITIDVDWTLSNCAGTTAGIMYGNWVNGTLQTGTIIVNRLGNTFQLWSFNTTVTATGISCVNNTPVHVKLVIKQAGGVDVYFNDSATPNASLNSTQAPSSYNNQTIQLQHYDTSTLTFDNFIVSQDAVITVPSAPTSLTATPSDSQVALSWTAPASNGGAAITDYVIEYKLSSEPTTWTTFADGTSTTTSATVTGLTNDLSYDFRVSATNSVGTSAVSDTDTATPALSAPSVPQSLAALVGTSGQASLSWSAPLTNGGAAITDYVIEYKLSTEPTTWTTFADGTSTTTSATVTGLTNNLSYDFRVSATNSVGTGTVSDTATATPNVYDLYDVFSGTTIDTEKWNEIDGAGSGGTSGLIQQNDHLTIVGDASWGNTRLVSQTSFDRSSSPVLQADFSLSHTGVYAAPIVYGTNTNLIDPTAENLWLVAHAGGPFYIARGYHGAWATLTSTGVSIVANRRYRGIINIGETSGATFELYQDTNGDGDFTDTGEDTDLLVGHPNSISEGTFSTGYFISSTYSTTLTTTLYNAIVSSAADTVPSAPTALTATPSDSQVALSWTAPASNGGAAITDYVIEYKLSSEPTTWTTFADGTSTTTSATVTGLTNDLSYDFRVSATNSVGTSAVSDTDTATPALSAPSVPQSLAALVGTSGQASLSWSAPLTNGGAAITDYVIEYKLSTEPTTWTTFADGTSTTTSATVTGLTNNLSYDFRVSATNSVGTGTVSDTATATPNVYDLYDVFSGTTIDIEKWNETDSAVSGSGGLAGNVQQNDSLTVTGNGAWGTNGVESIDTFDRTNGDVEITVTMQSTSCTTGNSFEFGYGDMDIVNAGTAYIVTKNDASWQLYSWNNGSSAGVSTITGISCSNNTDLTLKLVVLQAGGAEVYVGDSETPGATQSWGTFTNAPVWLQNFSTGITTTFKNIYVTEPVTGPYAPTNLEASVGDGQVSLSWTAGDDNGSAITDYVIEYKISSAGSWSTFSDGVSTNTSAIVTELTNGVLYNFRVSAVNINGTSNPSSTGSATPVSSVPTAPSAVSVSISGETSVDEQITGTYVFADPNGDAEGTSLFRWLKADTADGVYSAIAGATSVNYTITSGELNKYLKFEVTPVSSTTPTTGTPVLSSATNQVDEVSYFNHILSTGQSLSTGTNGAPALSTTQPYSNKMLSGSSLVPLIESSVETMSSAMANTLTALSPLGNFQSAVTRHGVGGTAYSGLKKGTSPYSNGITQATNVKNAATALGLTDRVIGVTTIHGESDHLAGNGAYYESYLVEWQNDYNTDVKAITGQSSDIPLFTDQMSSHTGYNATTSLIPIAQLSAAENNPGDIILVGPKYFLNYSDSAHLVAASYRWLGEYYGKVMKKVVIDHESWRPLSPDLIIRSGNIIYANFHVPAGELVFDTTLVNAKTNYGFEYYDSTSSASISSVEILDTDTVKITLSGVPSGSDQRLRYAYTGTAGAQPGASVAGSAHGNLRDTDSTSSLYGNTLYNWSVHFDKAITPDSTAPTISSVSSNKTNGTYGEGEVIDIDVTFSEAVTSTGNVTVTLETGTIDRTCTFTVSNSATGTCNYTVQGGDTSSLLTVSSISGTIVDQGNNAMVNFIPATNLASNKALVLDTVDPEISLVSSTPSSTSVAITWTTDELGSSIVNYGLTSSYGSSTSEIDTSPRKTSGHSVTLTGLVACTTYHYQVQSTDAYTNMGNGEDGTFTTTGCTGTASIIDTAQEAITTASGGTLARSNISLTIPASFTDSANSVIFQANKLDNTNFSATVDAPSGFARLGTDVYTLKALSNATTVISSFDEPISITFTYSASDVGTLDESSLLIYRYDGSAWHALENCTVDTSAHTITCTTQNFSDFAMFGEEGVCATVSHAATYNTYPTCGVITCNAGYTLSNGTCVSMGSAPAGWLNVPTTPPGGFKIISNQGSVATTSRVVTLNFNAGSDVQKMAISLTGDFDDANQENYSPTKQIDLCSKFGGFIKNPTCPDGQYMVYVKFYTQYGKASDTISTKINLATTTQSPTNSKLEITESEVKILQQFSKDLKLGITDSQVKILQQFLNQNGYKLANSGVGSPGKETNYFGTLTSNALTKFQEANKDRVLGVINEKGYLGPKTRQLINSSTNTTTNTTNPTIPTKQITQIQNSISAVFMTPLYKGLQSEDVRRFQTLLATKPEIYPEGKITGYFGSLTEKAVQNFQLNYGIVVSKDDPGFGYVGPTTRAKLQEVFGDK